MQKRVMLAGLLGAIAMIVSALAGAALAAGPFTDTPGTFFEDEIDEIAAAGCAAGYSDGSFRPAAATTRGQFAYWMSNCGGRLVWAPVSDTLDGPQYGGVVVASREFYTPGVPGGLAEWAASASVTFRVADPSACPCGVTAQLREVGGTGSEFYQGVIPGDAPESGVSTTTLSVDTAFRMPTDSEVELELMVYIDDSDVVDVEIRGEFWASLQPFRVELVPEP